MPTSKRSRARALVRKPASRKELDCGRLPLFFGMNEECYVLVHRMTTRGDRLVLDIDCDVEFDIPASDARRRLLTLNQLRLKAKSLGAEIAWMADLALLGAKPQSKHELHPTIRRIPIGRRWPRRDAQTRYQVDRLNEWAARKESERRAART